MPRGRPREEAPANGQEPLPGFPKTLTAEDLYPDPKQSPPVVTVEIKYLSGYKVGALPDRAMVQSVKVYGLLHPIGIMPVFPKDKQEPMFLVWDGRRRVQAAILAGLTEVPARIYNEQTWLASVLTLVANGQRRPNPWAEWLAIEDLLHAHAGLSLIAEVTGLPVATIKRRLKLGNLIATFAREVDQGRMSATVAEALASLPIDYQERLLGPLAMTGRLTMGDVRHVRRVESKATADQYLPQRLFGEESAAPVDHLAERYGRVYAALCAALGDDVAAAIASGQGADGADAEVPFSDEAEGEEVER
jgi:ParB-like chromosome segregation protein Spo0J